MNKSELLNWLQEQYQQWQALLAQIGETRLGQPGVNGEWSMKDLVAHLTGWNRWLVARLQAAQRGEPEPPPPWSAQLQSEDEINAWIDESNRGRTARQVLDESDQLFQQLLTVIASLPDDLKVELLRIEGREFHPIWLGDQRFPPGEFFYHFRDDHEPDVRAWLARQEK